MIWDPTKKTKPADCGQVGQGRDRQGSVGVKTNMGPKSSRHFMATARHCEVFVVERQAGGLKSQWRAHFVSLVKL